MSEIVKRWWFFWIAGILMVAGHYVWPDQTTTQRIIGWTLSVIVAVVVEVSLHSLRTRPR